MKVKKILISKLTFYDSSLLHKEMIKVLYSSIDFKMISNSLYTLLNNDYNLELLTKNFLFRTFSNSAFYFCYITNFINRILLGISLDLVNYFTIKKIEQKEIGFY